MFDLPANAFREEGAEVRTSIAVFGRYRNGKLLGQAVTDLAEPLPALKLNQEGRLYGEKPRLNHQLLDDTGPTITRPMTSQKRVRLSHDGRRIVLGFEYGSLCWRSGSFPREVTQKLSQTLQATLSDKALRDKLAAQGAEVMTGTPQQFGNLLKADIDKWAEIVKASGAQID